jgi:hypothetical protein
MSSLFPSADCDADAIAFVAANVPDSARAPAPCGPVGFHLIRNTLVPYAFVEAVQDELLHMRLNCFAVTRVADLFTEEFLASLTPNELDILGETLLVLIENGLVAFSLGNAKEAA